MKNLKLTKKIISLLTGSIMLFSGLKYAKSEKNNYTEVDYNLQEYSFISQNDQMFIDNKFHYNGKRYFYENGCGPSSVINSMVLGFDLKNKDIMYDFTRESLRLFTINHKPESNSFKVDLMKTLDRNKSNYLNKNSNNYPIYTELLDNFVGNILFMDQKVNYDNLVSNIDSNSNNLIFSKIYDLHINDLLNIIYDLYKNNYYGDIVINGVSAGKENYNRPFKTKFGHYICYYFNVKEFIENGSFYLIDSLPRNLENESLYKNTFYFVDYPNEYKFFLNNFNLERISENVIKINFNDIELLRSLNNKSDYIEYVYSRIKTFGIGGNVGLVMKLNEKVLNKGK